MEIDYKWFLLNEDQYKKDIRTWKMEYKSGLEENSIKV